MRFTIVPAACGIAIGWRHRVFVDGIPCELVVEALEVFVDRLCDERVRMGSYHDVGVGRIWPLRHPSSLLIVLQKSSDHAVDALRSQQCEQAMLGAKCIPYGVGGVGHAFVHLVVKGAVVTALP